MFNSYIPKLSMNAPAGSNPFRHVDFMGGVQKSNLDNVQGPEKVSFKNVILDSLNNVNGIAKTPDALMQQALTGGNVDVHDVMIANAKAELAVNMTAQITTKVIQAYDRILQIQV